MEIKVRRSKYSIMEFLEPNRTKLLLPPLSHWWVLMCTPHRKWKSTKKFVFPTKVFEPWPRLGCSLCEGTWCVCPQVWRGMAGEGTIRTYSRGMLFYESQEWIKRTAFASAAMYTSVNEHFGHHLHCLLSCSCERGCEGSVTLFMDEWGTMNVWE